MTQFLYESLSKKTAFWISMLLGAIAAACLAGLFLFRSQYLINADKDLQSLVETRNAYATFRTALGYGGFIHNFKNYVLRGDRHYLELANDQMKRSMAEWSEVQSQVPGFYTEKSDILTMLKNYSMSLETANTEPRLNAENLDSRVKVDDGPALRAMARLSGFINSQIQQTNGERRHMEVTLGLWMALSGFLLLLSIFIGYLNRSIRMERAETAEREQEIRRRVRQLTAHNSMLELQQSQAERLGGFGTWILNLDNWDLQWSDGVFALHGRPVTAGVPTGHETEKYYSEETRKKMLSHIRHAAQDRASFMFDFDLTRDDGEKREILGSCQFADHMGHHYLVGVFRDITDKMPMVPPSLLNISPGDA